MERKQHATVPAQLQMDEILAFTFYTKVKRNEPDGSRVHVYDLDNRRDMSIVGSELVASAASADQFAEEVKVGKTEAAELLIGSVNRPFTVCFEKADGSERRLRGRLVRHEALLGRSMVEDLDIDGKDKLRQVDHRTIRWLVVDGVKYIVK